MSLLSKAYQDGWDDGQKQGEENMRPEIERQRAALTMARAYIEDQPIAHAVVIPRGQHPSGSDPSLLAVIDAALGHQQVSDNDICAACGSPRREHEPGGTRSGPMTLCGAFIPQQLSGEK